MIESFKLHRDFYNYLLLLVVLCAGLLTYKDYGLCWDEVLQYNDNGRVVYNFVTTGNSAEYLSSPEKYHGGIIELFLYAVKEVFSIDDSRSNFLMRHLVSFLCFWLSGFFMLSILKKLYASRVVILTGLAMYFLAPRIFADAFYNSKDVPFLATLTVCIYTFLVMLERPGYKSMALHGLVCGLLISIRITGIIVPVLSIVSFIIAKHSELGSKVKGIFLSFYLLITIACLILFWPILWLNPLHHFLGAWNEMRHFHWDNTVLFKGELVHVMSLPWDYIPFWFYNTTPPFYLLLFISSCLLIPFTLIKKRANLKLIAKWLFISGLFFTPVLAVIILKSVVYDAWRHLLFIYVPFVIVSCFTVQKAMEMGKRIRVPVLIVLPFVFFSVFVSMKNLHPYEYIYFNNLYYNGIKGAKYQMEMDYWGLSYQEALRYILDHDQRPKLKVLVDDDPGRFNLQLLNEKQQERLEIFRDKKLPYDYFVGVYRWYTSDYTLCKEFYRIERYNTSITFIGKPE